MSKFHVRDTFELPEKQLFVLAGSVVEGEISAGMFVHVPFNPSFSLTDRIHAVERLTGDDGVELALCFEADEDLAEFWRGTNVGDEILDVTNDDGAEAYLQTSHEMSGRPPEGGTTNL